MSYKEIDIDWLQEIIVPAIDALYQNPSDRDLLDRDVNERTVVANICCKTYISLHARQQNSPELENLCIDLEYNRNYKFPKEVFALCGSCEENCISLEHTRAVRSYPDLIIHQRGTNENNQVVIEFKKEGSGSPRARKSDEEKLTYFTCQKSFPGHEKESYQFRHGYFIDLKSNGYEVTSFHNAKNEGTEFHGC